MRPPDMPLHPTDRQTWAELCLEIAIGALTDYLPCAETRELRIEVARILTLLIAQRTPAQIHRLELAKGLRS